MKRHLNVLGIYREEKYSNRAVEVDKAILDEVLNCLRLKLKGQVAITAIRPEHTHLGALDFDFDLVFSMAQDEDVLIALELMEKRGTIIVNSSQSIRNCYRTRLSRLLNDDEFSYPRYVHLKLDQKYHEAFLTHSGFWIKRGDFHSLHDEDVVYIEGIEDLAFAIENFKMRGVTEVILQENCEGELFKFYGVRDQFFNLRYMGRTSTNRFHFSPGDSEISFDRQRLEFLVYKAAHVLNLDYFGGDCIVTNTGKVHFIDFNDWPSFRTCAKTVAPIMVNYALSKLRSEATNVASINQ